MRMGFEEGPEAANHFFHRLVELGLVGVALLQPREKGINGFDHQVGPRRPRVGSH
jgi:hypothetical protein